MSDFTVYRGKCSPDQLRNILLAAMTIRGTKEIKAAMLKSRVKIPRSNGHVFLPANWCRGNSRVNRVEFCNYDHTKILRQNGIVISPRLELFDVPEKTKDVMGVSFWELSKIKKRSKSGNYFEASRDINILLNERGDGPLFSVTFDVCVREKVRVNVWGLKLHSGWLDFLRIVGVKLEQVQE